MSKHLGFTYFGGKRSHLPKLLPLMPEGDYHFVDLFGGGGSVCLNAPYANRTYNDLDEGVFNYFYCLREWGEELVEKVWLTPFSEKEFRFARDVRKDPIPEDASKEYRIERARCFFFLLSAARSSNPHTPGGFRFSVTSTTRNGVSIDVGKFNGRTEHLRKVAEEVKRLQILNRPALKIIEQFDREGTFFYADPPYLWETRVVSQIGGGGYYRHEMSDEDHRTLLRALRGAQGRVMVSGYPCGLYDEELEGWEVREFGAKTINHGTGVSSDRTEKVWMNYDPNEGQGVLGL